MAETTWSDGGISITVEILPRKNETETTEKTPETLERWYSKIADRDIPAEKLSEILLKRILKNNVGRNTTVTVVKDGLESKSSYKW